MLQSLQTHRKTKSARFLMSTVVEDNDDDNLDTPLVPSTLIFQDENKEQISFYYGSLIKEEQKNEQDTNQSMSSASIRSSDVSSSSDDLVQYPESIRLSIKSTTKSQQKRVIEPCIEPVQKINLLVELNKQELKAYNKIKSDGIVLTTDVFGEEYIIDRKYETFLSIALQRMFKKRMQGTFSLGQETDIDDQIRTRNSLSLQDYRDRSLTGQNTKKNARELSPRKNNLFKLQNLNFTNKIQDLTICQSPNSGSGSNTNRSSNLELRSLNKLVESSLSHKCSSFTMGVHYQQEDRMSSAYLRNAGKRTRQFQKLISQVLEEPDSDTDSEQSLKDENQIQEKIKQRLSRRMSEIQQKTRRQSLQINIIDEMTQIKNPHQLFKHQKSYMTEQNDLIKMKLMGASIILIIIILITFFILAIIKHRLEIKN